MNPNPEVHSTGWDDEIDLRQLIETVYDRKWMIAAITAVAVVIAAVFSYFVLAPRYEATIVISLPSESESDVGLNAKAYEAFAVNEAVLAEVVRQGNLQINLESAKKRYNVALDSQSRLLTVTAHAETGNEAYELVRLWKDAFQGQLADYTEGVIAGRLVQAERNVARAQAALEADRERLNEFTKEHAVSLNAARLNRLEEELVEAEMRLHQLTEELIPADAAQIVYLESVMSSVEPSLEGSARTEGPVANPTYVEHLQEVSRLRSRLTSNEKQADLLQTRRGELEERIRLLRTEVMTLAVEETRLQDDVALSQKAYADARQQRQELQIAHENVRQSTFVTVISAPILPAGPVAPRKMLNIALAAFLGAFVGVGVAFFQHFWNESSKQVGAVS